MFDPYHTHTAPAEPLGGRQAHTCLPTSSAEGRLRRPKAEVTTKAGSNLNGGCEKREGLVKARKLNSGFDRIGDIGVLLLSLRISN